MRTTLFFVLLFFSGLGQAVICKIVGPDGGVSYTDVPRLECPNEVELPEYSRYTPRKIERPPVTGDAQAVAPFTGYTAFGILSPEPNGTVRSNEGKVDVALSLEPGLRPSDRIELFLDGVQLAGSFDGLGIRLNNIERGTHALRAQVKSASGRVMIQTGSHLFTLRKASLLDPLRQSDNGGAGGGTGGGEGGGGDGDADASNKPSSPGGARFTPGGSSSTPGRTNPAFTPNFSPGGARIPTTPGRTNPAFTPGG